MNRSPDKPINSPAAEPWRCRSDLAVTLGHPDASEHYWHGLSGQIRALQRAAAPEEQRSGGADGTERRRRWTP